MTKNPCSCSILSTRVAVATDSKGRESELLFCAACGAILDEKPISTRAGPLARRRLASNAVDEAECTPG